MIEFRIKERTRSLNESFRGDWRPRDAIAKRQRAKAMAACPKWPGGPFLRVRVTRVSPRELDPHDNLRGALKHVVDGVAACLKIDDASPLVAWEYHQAKGEAEVVVQIWKAAEDAPPLPVGRPVERKRGKALAKASGDAGVGQKRVPRKSYEPPRSTQLNAASEDEATFAPVPPCEHCGDPYRPQCFDPKAPPGAVKCRKYVHCYRFDGHDGDCSVLSPRECAT